MWTSMKWNSNLVTTNFFNCFPNILHPHLFPIFFHNLSFQTTISCVGLMSPLITSSFFALLCGSWLVLFWSLPLGYCSFKVILFPNGCMGGQAWVSYRKSWDIWKIVTALPSFRGCEERGIEKFFKIDCELVLAMGSLRPINWAHLHAGHLVKIIGHFFYIYWPIHLVSKFLLHLTHTCIS